MLDVVDENSTWVLTITFRDRNGNLATPASATYRIDEATLEGSLAAEVRDDTALAPIASEFALSLTPADNAIVGTGDPAFQERVVTVTATYGADDVKVDEYRYRVRNLRFA
jgi:hypothetical protein